MIRCSNTEGSWRPCFLWHWCFRYHSSCRWSHQV